jgi:hypothetical protein
VPGADFCLLSFNWVSHGRRPNKAAAVPTPFGSWFASGVVSRLAHPRKVYKCDHRDLFQDGRLSLFFAEEKIVGTPRPNKELAS